MINFPAAIALPTTGEILRFSHEDMEMHQGWVGVYVGYTNSPTTVAFELSLAQAFAEPAPE